MEFEEDIEYLRFLEKGIKVKCIELSDKSIAVDTNEDLIKVKKIIQSFEKNKNNKLFFNIKNSVGIFWIIYIRIFAFNNVNAP